MTKPSYQDLYPLILNNSQNPLSAEEYLNIVANNLNLSEDDLAERYPSGEAIIKNRVRWAIHYLRRANLLEKPTRGHYVITERGKDFQKKYPTTFNNNDLSQFPEFLEFRGKGSSTNSIENLQIPELDKSELTPVERIEISCDELDEELKKELLERILDQSPSFFERMVVTLLSKMGYGTESSLSKAIGKSGDGGIDGIIHQDKLGLDVVYIQAKRYDPSNQVGRPDMNAFVGSLAGHQSTKGVFVTTSYFSKPALEYLKTIQTRVVAIDGKKLVELMIEHEVGTRIAHQYNLNKIDEDFFLD
jgi:restriction system protein